MTGKRKFSALATQQPTLAKRKPSWKRSVKSSSDTMEAGKPAKAAAVKKRNITRGSQRRKR